jgi:serine/threonine-protein kinase
VGTTLKDFRVEKLLGRGGMGEVYLATQLSLNRPVALKVLLSAYASNPNYLSRLRTEATAVAKLNHPNIVHVYTLDSVDDIHFIAMEYVQGTNLREYIVKKGALDLPLALSIMRQTAQAIGAAGELGLIHRDIKPENILMTRKGRVKVADFGLCRDLDETNAHVTQTGVTMGTPLYMSPEQAQGHAIDHRSDLYSLGVTYYHMLTGVGPFHAENAVALALKHVREQPRSMLVHRADLPVELDRLVLKLMAKDPMDRYQSAGEMLDDLTAIREAVAVSPTAAIPDASAGPTTSSAKRSSSQNSRAGVPTAALGLSAISGPDGTAGSLKAPARQTLNLRWGIIGGIGLACLAIGTVAGWAGRAPDVQSIALESAQPAPGLWLEHWEAIPKQNTVEEQFRYAQFQAPRADWSAAWVAVPGYFPNAHDLISRAYTQLARIYYRRCDLLALAGLESELASWKERQTRDQELVDVIRIAIKLRKGDMEGVVEGLRGLPKNELSVIFDAGLVELTLEICADAIAHSMSGGVPVARESLHQIQRQLALQLYRIEVRPQGNAQRAGGKSATKPLR